MRSCSLAPPTQACLRHRRQVSACAPCTMGTPMDAPGSRPPNRKIYILNPKSQTPEQALRPRGPAECHLGGQTQQQVHQQQCVASQQSTHGPGAAWKLRAAGPGCAPPAHCTPRCLAQSSSLGAGSAGELACGSAGKHVEATLTPALHHRTCHGCQV